MKEKEKKETEWCLHKKLRLRVVLYVGPDERSRRTNKREQTRRKQRRQSMMVLCGLCRLSLLCERANQRRKPKQAPSESSDNRHVPSFPLLPVRFPRWSSSVILHPVGVSGLPCPLSFSLSLSLLTLPAPMTESCVLPSFSLLGCARWHRACTKSSNHNQASSHAPPTPSLLWQEEFGVCSLSFFFCSS